MTQFTLELAQQLINSEQQFPVEFDLAWQWLGYSRKDNAKTNFLKCGFVPELDYRLLKVKETKPDGGFSHYEEKLTMTCECFKQWGMMVGTEKGKEIRLYFLECEKIAKQSLMHSQAITPLLESIASIQLQLSELTVQKEYVNKLQADKDALVQEQKEFDKAAHEHKGCADIILDTMEFGEIDDITMTTLQFIEAKGIEKRHRKRLANLAANFQRCGKNTNDIPKEKGQLLLEVRYLKQATKVVLGLD